MKFVATAALVCLSLAAIAQPPTGPVTPGSSYGAKVETAGATPVTQLTTTLGDAKKATVRFEGVVSDVCVKEGCWLKVQNGDQKVMVKMKGHSWFVPVALQGKTVVIEGEASQVVTPVAELKHYAEDAGKSKAEIDAIKDPKREISVQATGLVVVK